MIEPLRTYFTAIFWIGAVSGPIFALGAGISRADASPLAELEAAAVRAAADSIAGSVVQIRTIGGQNAAGGAMVADAPTTGLIISADGHVLTSAFNFAQHPVSILVIFANGDQLPAELVATDHSRMLVLLKVAGGGNFTVPEFAPLEETKPGQWAVAVGRTYRADEINLSVGIVSAVNRMFGKAIQTDAAISTANYGGPLVDVQGRVLGLIVPMAPHATPGNAGVEWYDSGIGFAAPLEPITKHIERMKEGEDQRAGLLGIEMADGDPHTSPATLATVRPGSPASRAGLKKGDRIIEINDFAIETQTDLRFALGPLYGGDSVQLVAMRDDQQLQKSVQLVGVLPTFRHAFLGVLPMRSSGSPASADDNAPSDDHQPQLVVRKVYEASPADNGGIQIGDHILQINGEEVQTVASAHRAMSNLVPGDDVKVLLKRGTTELELQLSAGRLPTVVPTELPPAAVPDANTDGEAQPDEQRQRVIKLPEFPNDCHVLLPRRGSDAPLPGLLLWLSADGKPNVDEIIDKWQDDCNRFGFMLLVPTAANEQKWETTEIEYLARLIERVRADYKIDPHRVVVYGEYESANLAWLLGLTKRDVFKGIATTAPSLPPQFQPPSNEPSLRLAIFAAVASSEAGTRATDGLDAVSSAGYPVTTVTLGGETKHLSARQREEMARWIDTLDRF